MIASQANVAQLVEQLTRNEQVTGSSPVIGSPENASNEAKMQILGRFCFAEHGVGKPEPD